MSGSTGEAMGVVIYLSRRRRARRLERRRDLWLPALVLGALLALLFALPRPLAAHARADDEPTPSALAD